MATASLGKNIPDCFEICPGTPKKDVYKTDEKTDQLVLQFVFHRLPELVFSWRTRESIPLGRNRGGSATQNVAQTKFRVRLAL